MSIPNVTSCPSSRTTSARRSSEGSHNIKEEMASQKAERVRARALEQDRYMYEMALKMQFTPLPHNVREHDKGE